MSARLIYDFGLVSSFFYAKPEMQGFSLVPPGWRRISTPFYIFQSHVGCRSNMTLKNIKRSAVGGRTLNYFIGLKIVQTGDGTELRNSAGTINFYRSLESSCGVEWNCSGSLLGDRTPLNIASAEYCWR